MNAAQRVLLSPLPVATALACEADCDELIKTLEPVPDLCRPRVELSVADAWTRGYAYALREIGRGVKDVLGERARKDGDL